MHRQNHEVLGDQGDTAVSSVNNRTGKSPAACASTRTPKRWTGHHRLFDGSPLDIHGSVVIRRGRELAHDTTKISLGATVRPFGMPTGATALAGIARVNVDHAHTCALCLVGDKLAQLPKGPIAVSRSLFCATNPYPLADALQVFQGNPASGALGFCNESLADT